MDGNQLLKNYISHIERLKKEFSLVSVIYAIKPQAEIDHREPNFDLPVPQGLPIPPKADNSQTKINFLKNGEAIRYELYQTDKGIFVAVLWGKASEGQPGKENYRNDRKTYCLITNSEEVANGKYQGLFRGYKVLTIDEVIKELGGLEIPDLKR